MHTTPLVFLPKLAWNWAFSEHVLLFEQNEGFSTHQICSKQSKGFVVLQNAPVLHILVDLEATTKQLSYYNSPNPS